MSKQDMCEDVGAAVEQDDMGEDDMGEDVEQDMGRCSRAWLEQDMGAGRWRGHVAAGRRCGHGQ
jgi:hypothetical protein